MIVARMTPSPSSPLTRSRFLASGVVQGVGFRWEAREQALRLGVTGLVRNLFDGRVEAEAQGTPAVVSRFGAWMRHGPRWARVTDVIEEPIPPVLGEVGFRIAK